MLTWIIGIAVCLLIWAAIWKRNLILAFGILIGVLLAWGLSYLLKPYVAGVKPVPPWLPPIPLATVAVTLFVYGALVWIKGDKGLPKVKRDDRDAHH